MVLCRISCGTQKCNLLGHQSQVLKGCPPCGLCVPSCWGGLWLWLIGEWGWFLAWLGVCPWLLGYVGGEDSQWSALTGTPRLQGESKWCLPVPVLVRWTEMLLPMAPTRATGRAPDVFCHSGRPFKVVSKWIFFIRGVCFFQIGVFDWLPG